MRTESWMIYFPDVHPAVEPVPSSEPAVHELPAWVVSLEWRFLSCCRPLVSAPAWSWSRQSSKSSLLKVTLIKPRYSSIILFAEDDHSGQPLPNAKPQREKIITYEPSLSPSCVKRFEVFPHQLSLVFFCEDLPSTCKNCWFRQILIKKCVLPDLSNTAGFTN